MKTSEIRELVKALKYCTEDGIYAMVPGETHRQSVAAIETLLAREAEVLKIASRWGGTNPCPEIRAILNPEGE